VNHQHPEPFSFRDCALTTLSLGRSALNLRELREGVAEVSAESISHHFFESLMRPVFDDPEYRNDFALWARRQLHDNPLAERLGIIDPVEHEDLESLRRLVLEVIEDRLDEAAVTPTAAPGHEFYFLRSQKVVLDMGLQAQTPADLAVEVPRLPTGSIYFHFVDGRRRPPRGVDDFSRWIQGWGPGYEACLERMSSIDFQLWSLTELRAHIAACLKETLPRSKAAGRRKS
jgi:Family of unknown function (DUF5752)